MHAPVNGTAVLVLMVSNQVLYYHHITIYPSGTDHLHLNNAFIRETQVKYKTFEFGFQ